MLPVILIKTCQRYRDRRAACEETWVADLRARGVKVYFVEGGHKIESFIGDTIKVTTGDAYDDNSLKLRDGLRVLMRAAWNDVFICDDDTFVHPARWLEFADWDHLAPFIGLNSEKIPWVHGGAGWFMERRCCEWCVDEIERRFSGDDVIVSEILTRHGIVFDSRPELFSQWKDRVSADNQLITCHEVSPDEMRVLFSETKHL